MGKLDDMKCGELRWTDRKEGWEVLIPSVAYKNSGSSLFGQKPFRLIPPDLLDLYRPVPTNIAGSCAAVQGPRTLFVIITLCMSRHQPGNNYLGPASAIITATETPPPTPSEASACPSSKRKAFSSEDA